MLTDKVLATVSVLKLAVELFFFLLLLKSAAGLLHSGIESPCSMPPIAIIADKSKAWQDGGQLLQKMVSVPFRCAHLLVSICSSHAKEENT